MFCGRGVISAFLRSCHSFPLVWRLHTKPFHLVAFYCPSVLADLFRRYSRSLALTILSSFLCMCPPLPCISFASILLTSLLLSSAPPTLKDRANTLHDLRRYGFTQRQYLGTRVFAIGVKYLHQLCLVGHVAVVLINSCLVVGKQIPWFVSCDS